MTNKISIYKQNTFLDTLSIVETLAKSKYDLFRKYYDLLILLEERTELKLLVAFDEAKKDVLNKLYLMEPFLSSKNVKKNIVETMDIPLEPRFKYCSVGNTLFKEYTFSIEMREWLVKAGVSGVINDISFINPDPFYEGLYSGMFDAYNTGGNTVFSTFELGIDFALRDENVEKFFRNYALKLSEQVSKTVSSAIKYELSSAIKNGYSIPEVTKNILKHWDNPIQVVVPPKISPDGTIIRNGYSYEMSPKHWATTVSRTEINGAYNKGRLDGFKQTGVVDRVQFSTSPDERLCPICAVLEGTIYTLEQAVGVIPQHANCRCQWIPLLATEKFEDALPIAEANVLAEYLSPVENSLTSGEIKSIENLGGGVNTTQLTSNGVKGVFKPKSGEAKNMRDSIQTGTFYKREIAAYRIDKAFDFDLVPPTVKRKINGKWGSHQEFKKGYKVWGEATTKQMMLVKTPDKNRLGFFDYLIANEDRHRMNFMVNNKGKLSAIDNGLTLGSGNVSHYRNFWDRELNYMFSKPVDLSKIDGIKDVLLKMTPQKIDIMKRELLDGKLLDEAAFKSLLGRIKHTAENYKSFQLKPKLYDGLGDIQEISRWYGSPQWNVDTLIQETKEAIEKMFKELLG